MIITPLFIKGYKNGSQELTEFIAMCIWIYMYVGGEVYVYTQVCTNAYTILSMQIANQMSIFFFPAKILNVGPIS